MIRQTAGRSQAPQSTLWYQTRLRWGLNRGVKTSLPELRPRSLVEGRIHSLAFVIFEVTCVSGLLNRSSKPVRGVPVTVLQSHM